MKNWNHYNAQLFPDCRCLKSGNNHSDSDLSPFSSQYVKYTDFTSYVNKLISNDLSLLHCNVRSLYKNIDKLDKIVSLCSKLTDIIVLSEKRN